MYAIRSYYEKYNKVVSEESEVNLGDVIYSEPPMMGNQFNPDIYQGFRVIVDDLDNVEEVEKKIRKLGYETYSSITALNESKKQTAFLRTTLGVIGVVSFFVAARNNFV